MVISSCRAYSTDRAQQGSWREEVMGEGSDIKDLWTSGVQRAQEEAEGKEVRRRRKNSGKKKIRRGEERE